MPRTVTYRVGLENWERFKKQVPEAERELTVEIHELDAEPWPVGQPLRHVGHDVPRVDGPAKATGAARYTYDVNRAGMAFAGFVGSPHAHANVTRVDTTAAAALPGVLGVKAFEGTRVTYAGKIVAAVCAESETALADALAAVVVQYEVLPASVTTDDGMKAGAPTVSPQRGTNVVPPRSPLRKGKVNEAFREAAARVEATYRTAIQTHSCLEPHGCVVEIGPEGDATVWASTQATAGFATGRFVRSLGVAPNKVRVLTEHMGGGFGSKFGALEWDVIGAEFARETQRPVRVMLPRRLEHLLGGNRPDSIQKLALAGSKDGRIAALKGEVFGTAGNGPGGTGASNFMVYEFPALDMTQSSVTTHTWRGAAFRAPRHPQGSFAMEGIIELYAHAIGMDPLEVRMKNDPHPVRQVQWRIGAERIDWKRNRRRVPGSDAGPVKRGLGCAASRWSSPGRHRAGRQPLYVDMILDREGGVVVQSCVQDLGTGTRTVMAVLAAEELGTDPGRVDVRIGDTRFPAGPGSGGSTTAPSVGPAVRDAAVRAKEALIELLAREWEVDAATVTWHEDGVFRAPGGLHAGFASACALVGKDGLRVRGERRPNWDSPYRETAGCQFAQVAVDVETGVIRVEKVVAVHDCGRVIDTLTARSQVNGGVIQGISFALYEEKRLDRNLGDMVNPTLDTYRILGMADCPEIDAVMTSVVSGFNNAGMMGLGEPATVPTAAAVANAVFNALGVQVRELPMTPARVLAALERSRG